MKVQQKLVLCFFPLIILVGLANHQSIRPPQANVSARLSSFSAAI